MTLINHYGRNFLERQIALLNNAAPLLTWHDLLGASVVVPLVLRLEPSI